MGGPELLQHLVPSHRHHGVFGARLRALGEDDLRALAGLFLRLLEVHVRVHVVFPVLALRGESARVADALRVDLEALHLRAGLFLGFLIARDDRLRGGHHLLGELHGAHQRLGHRGRRYRQLDLGPGIVPGSARWMAQLQHKRLRMLSYLQLNDFRVKYINNNFKTYIIRIST